MKMIFSISGCMIFLLLTSMAQAQIYKSKDADGNVVYTDVPPTDEAKEVNLNPMNTADSVEVRPPETKQAEAQGRQVGGDAQPSGGDPVYLGTNNGLTRDKVNEEKRQRELHERAKESNGVPARPSAPRAAPRPAVKRGAAR